NMQMQRMIGAILNFLLVLIALLIFYPLTIINMLFVGNVNQYLFETALSIDIFAQYEFRTMFNRLLITSDSIHRFGKDRRVSVSYVLGKNQVSKTLSGLGGFI